MERKLKFSEFAELIGVTAKTVYKMKDREEIKTVIEKVNGREIQLVVTNTDEIEKFRLMNGKGVNNNGNYEDILTDCEASVNSNNTTQINNNNVTVMEMFDRVIQLNEEYNNRIAKLNEELVNSKTQVLYLEDKAGREGFYLKEINELKTENEALRTSRKTVITTLLTVTVILLLVLVGLITFNVAQNTVNESEINIEAKKNEPAVQEIVKPVPQTRGKR